MFRDIDVKRLEVFDLDVVDDLEQVILIVV